MCFYTQKEKLNLKCQLFNIQNTFFYIAVLESQVNKNSKDQIQTMFF